MPLLKLIGPTPYSPSFWWLIGSLCLIARIFLACVIKLCWALFLQWLSWQLHIMFVPYSTAIYWTYRLVRSSKLSSPTHLNLYEYWVWTYFTRKAILLIKNLTRSDTFSSNRVVGELKKFCYKITATSAKNFLLAIIMVKVWLNSDWITLIIKNLYQVWSLSLQHKL